MPDLHWACRTDRSWPSPMNLVPRCASVTEMIHAAWPRDNPSGTGMRHLRKSSSCASVAVLSRHCASRRTSFTERASPLSPSVRSAALRGPLRSVHLQLAPPLQGQRKRRRQSASECSSAFPRRLAASFSSNALRSEAAASTVDLDISATFRTIIVVAVRHEAKGLSVPCDWSSNDGQSALADHLSQGLA